MMFGVRTKPRRIHPGMDPNDPPTADGPRPVAPPEPK
jgi:hypothetical protein